MDMKKKTLFAIAGGGLSLALAAVAIGGFVSFKASEVGASSFTGTSTIAALATANKWVNGTAYTSWALDTYVTVSTTGTGNNGKYYSSGSGTWRLYQSGTGNLVVTVSNSYVITSIKVTYAVSNTGTITGLPSAAATAVANKTSVTYTIGNTGSATNGNVQISAISVTYGTGDDPTIAVAGVPSADLAIGDTGTLTVNTTNVTSPTVTWASSNTAAVSIGASTGTYTALAYGTSTITASMTVSGTVYSSTAILNVDGTDTIANILNLGLATGATTTYKLTTSGTITAVATSSVTISDGTKSLVVFGTYSPNNAAGKGWGVGGVISFQGNVQNFNGTYELTKPSLVSYTGNATALANFIMMANTADQCTTQFAIAKAQFQAMSAAEKTLFQTAQSGEAAVITNARARYEAWAVNQGDAAPYASGAAVVDGLANSTGMIAIAIVTVLGLLTLAGVVVLKKKHN
jgi:hypothetical protein